MMNPNTLTGDVDPGQLAPVVTICPTTTATATSPSVAIHECERAVTTLFGWEFHSSVTFCVAKK